MSGPRIFVSHSHEDNEFGLRLVGDLRRALGSEDAVWYDAAGGLHGGDQWWPRIVTELERSTVFAVILSPDALASNWVRDEIAIAWRLKNSARKMRIIPLLYRLCEVPADLSTLQAISFEASHKYEDALQQLADVLGIGLRIAMPKPVQMPSGFMPEDTLRRLPIYMLLDCNDTMAGDPIIAVNEGLGPLYRELINNPRAVETAWISIIVFGGGARQYPLTPIDQFQPPQLVAGGKRDVGAALRLLADSIQSDLKPNSSGGKGDYAPLVLLLTDGPPADEWRSQCDRLLAYRSNLRPTIVALDCGGGVNEAMLREVTENVFLMHNIEPATLRSFFRWVSGSIARTSQPQ